MQSHRCAATPALALNIACKMLRRAANRLDLLRHIPSHAAPKRLPACARLHAIEQVLLYNTSTPRYIHPAQGQDRQDHGGHSRYTLDSQADGITGGLLRIVDAPPRSCCAYNLPSLGV